MSAPPAHPRRRRWIPPEIGARYVRDIDGLVFAVRNVYRRDRQVLLVSDNGAERAYPFARDLERDYQAVAR